MQSSTNGLKLMTKIVDLAKTNPITAIILGFIVLALFTGGGSFAASFLGQGQKISMAIAELKNDLENQGAKLRKDLEVQDIYLKSAVKQERKDRILEIMHFKSDGKLLSESSIRLIIFEELRKSEDRIIARLK